MQLTDFHFDLPNELIARYPLPERSASRLLCLDKTQHKVTHRQFLELVELLEVGDLLVFNNSRVIPARLLGKKATGGQVEVLIERVLNQHEVFAHIRSSKSPKPGALLFFEGNKRFEMLGRKDDLFHLRCLEEESVLGVIEAIGQIPIPPYFERASEDIDKERYQTVYAEHKGSVAAPTAGLHFDTELLEKLQQKGVDFGYVTLHVGAGTFAPVRTADITEHQMHAEIAEVSKALCEKIAATKARGGRVIAVGTTSVRCLETASLSGELKPFFGETTIFMYPGKTFHCIDGLITNFHLPCSTLLMLVCALGGYKSVMAAYQEAVTEQYRFFSYGDAMILL